MVYIDEKKVPNPELDKSERTTFVPKAIREGPTPGKS